MRLSLHVQIIIGVCFSRKTKITVDEVLDFFYAKNGKISKHGGFTDIVHLEAPAGLAVKSWWRANSTYNDRSAYLRCFLGKNINDIVFFIKWWTILAPYDTFITELGAFDNRVSINYDPFDKKFIVNDEDGQPMFKTTSIHSLITWIHTETYINERD